MYRFLCKFIGEIPQDEALYEYYWDTEALEWVAWKDKVPKYIHDPDRKFPEILVPTVDTVRTTWLVENQVRIKRPALLVGETGTSKSATTQNFLRGKIHASLFHLTCFSE